MNNRTAGILLLTSIVAISNATAWNIAALITGISASLGTPTMVITTAAALLAGALVGFVIAAKPQPKKD